MWRSRGMISRDRMAAVDRNAEALGVPRRQLMESSGNAVAREVRQLASPGDAVLIVAGRGNNGGDGFVAARFLAEFDVTVRLLGRADAITTEIARANWQALVRSEYDIAEIRESTGLDLPPADVVVDAIVGTGVTGALREPAATAARQVTAMDAPVLSVDVPSGVDADTGAAAGASVAADRVVTFHDTKPGLTDLDAPVTVADIGIPTGAVEFVGPGDLASLDRDPDSHKGDAGRILVVGGGPYAGAPALTALAALHSGADLATVACPASVAETVQGYAPDLIVRSLPGERVEPGSVDRLLELAGSADCVVVGPGLGGAEETLRSVREFLRDFDGRAVVDADALSVVPEVNTGASLICTPHRAELVGMGGPRATDWRERRDAVTSFADGLGQTLLVKGRYDIVTDGDRTRVSRTGNPGMTVGGTGDVLAGATAAMFARKPDPLVAAGIAAYVTGLAGDAAATDRGNGLLASDVVDRLPGMFREATA